MTLRIELSQAPTEEQRAAILAPLRAYNIAKAGPSLYEPVALPIIFFKVKIQIGRAHV